MYTYINIFLITCRVTVAPDIRFALFIPLLESTSWLIRKNNLSCFSKCRLLLLFQTWKENV